MLASCFIWRISRREYFNTLIYLFPQLRVQWARIAGLLFALYVAIIFSVENLCSRSHCRPPPQPFAVVQPSILTLNLRTNFCYRIWICKLHFEVCPTCIWWYNYSLLFEQFHISFVDGLQSTGLCTYIKKHSQVYWSQYIIRQPWWLARFFQQSSMAWLHLHYAIIFENVAPAWKGRLSISLTLRQSHLVALRTDSIITRLQIYSINTGAITA